MSLKQSLSRHSLAAALGAIALIVALIAISIYSIFTNTAERAYPLAPESSPALAQASSRLNPLLRGYALKSEYNRLRLPSFGFRQDLL